MNTIEEKNNKRQEEIDQIIDNLKIVEMDLKFLLSQEDSKLSIEKNKLSELSSLSMSLRNKKENELSDFVISTTILLLIILMHSIITTTTLFYFILAIYIFKVPKYIKLYKMLKNKDIENLENTKNDIKDKIEESIHYKRTLEQKIRKTQYEIEEMKAEKEILDDINSYFKMDKEYEKRVVRQRRLI